MELDHELKQRLVGAAVITALAAIFVPMLFDDPVVERGQVVNELAVPEPPQIVVPEPAQKVEPAPVVQAATEDGTESVAAETSIENSEPPLMDAEMSQNELASEAEADRKAAEQLKKELATVDATKQPLQTKPDPIQKDVEASIAVTPKKSQENTSADSTLQNKKPVLAVKEQAQLEQKAAKKKAQDLLIAERKAQELALKEKNAALKLKQIELQEQAAGLKRAQEAALLEKKNAERLANQLAATEKLAKEKVVADKLAADKAAQQKADEYRKLIEQRAKEKIIVDKKLAEKAAFEAKVAAKQQAMDDKAALAKIAEDRKIAEKAAVEQKPDTAAPSRWFVRIGSFSQEANAIVLRDKIRKQGFPAAVDLVTSPDKGKLYRLRVGPDLSKDRAEKMRQKLDSENNTNSYLELE